MTDVDENISDEHISKNISKAYIVMVYGYNGVAGVVKVFKDKVKAENYAHEYAKNDRLGRNTFVIEKEFVE